MARNQYETYGIADFPRSEHRSRVSKAQRLMRKEGIDCMVLTSESNIGYFSGFRGTAGIETVDYSTSFLVLPDDGDPTLVMSLANRGNVEAMLAVGRADFVGWDRPRVADQTEVPQKTFWKASQTPSANLDHSLRR